MLLLRNMLACTRMHRNWRPPETLYAGTAGPHEQASFLEDARSFRDHRRASHTSDIECRTMLSVRDNMRRFRDGAEERVDDVGVGKVDVAVAEMR